MYLTINILATPKKKKINKPDNANFSWGKMFSKPQHVIEMPATHGYIELDMIFNLN
jgi:hypothetical protein